MIYERLKKEFGQYLGLFNTNNPADSNAIRLKEIHSIRVANQTLCLGRAIGLCGEDLETAGIAGLFHDIGRFRQYHVYKTFNDTKSENHALLGLKEIEDYGLFSGLSDYRAKVIKIAIENHNKIRLPEISDNRARFFSLLLRDADKLDIWRVMIAHVKKGNTGRHDPVTQNLPLSDIVSEKLLDYLEKGMPIPFSELENLNDYKLFLISWIFDLNFRPSIEAATRRQIIRQISETLPYSVDLKKRMEGLEKSLESMALAAFSGTSGFF